MSLSAINVYAVSHISSADRTNDPTRLMKVAGRKPGRKTKNPVGPASVPTGFSFGRVVQIPVAGNGHRTLVASPASRHGFVARTRSFP